ncbi:putative Holliday junction resolvase [Hordeum vulgare]|nr:putative Holliday junction resolvase [Hordeum vulgare]
MPRPVDTDACTCYAEVPRVGALQKLLLPLQVGYDGVTKDRDNELLKLLNGFRGNYVEALLNPLKLNDPVETKTMTDKFAAVCILQGYLDNMNRALTSADNVKSNLSSASGQ